MMHRLTDVDISGLDHSNIKCARRPVQALAAFVRKEFPEAVGFALGRGFPDSLCDTVVAMRPWRGDDGVASASRFVVDRVLREVRV